MDANAHATRSSRGLMVGNLAKTEEAKRKSSLWGMWWKINQPLLRHTMALKRQKKRKLYALVRPSQPIKEVNI